MYSNDAIRRIAAHYRTQATPAIARPDDVKLPPNDTLMSYYVAAERPSRKKLIEVLRDPQKLESKLWEHVPWESRDELPLLHDGVTPDMPAENIAASVRIRTGKFAIGEGRNFLAADAVPATYQFPSGKLVGYYRLRNEQSANVSILEMAYSLLDPGRIFIRDSSLAFLSAWGKVPGRRERLQGLAPYLHGIDRVVPGIIIAHELAEQDIISSGNVPKERVALELESERKASRFLEENGVSVGQYRVFHLLRAAESATGGKNVSKMVLDQIQPRD
jgi:hypothetical protein